MTELEAFKYGFLTRCIEDGLSREQTEERIKTAEILLEELGDGRDGLDKLATFGGGLVSGSLLGLGAVLTTAGAAGGLAGWGAGKLNQTDVDADDLKRQELIAAYQQQADHVRRAMARTAYRTANKPKLPRRALMAG